MARCSVREAAKGGRERKAGNGPQRIFKKKKWKQGDLSRANRVVERNVTAAEELTRKGHCDWDEDVFLCEYHIFHSFNPHAIPIYHLSACIQLSVSLYTATFITYVWLVSEKHWLVAVLELLRGGSRLKRA